MTKALGEVSDSVHGFIADLNEATKPVRKAA
jgi:hypothetical protein